MKKFGLIMIISLCAQNEEDRYEGSNPSIEVVNPGLAPLTDLAACFTYAACGYLALEFIQSINDKHSPYPKPVYSLLMYMGFLSFLENYGPASLRNMGYLRHLCIVVLAIDEILRT